MTTNTPREIELREKVESIYRASYLDGIDGTKNLEKRVGDLLSLISQHTDAVIDRVIGINEQELSPDGGKRYEARLIRNNLRGKQRQRYEQLKEGKR